ncbi:MAG: Zn-dependent hydrolase [Bacteroidales bacterium]|nr:Zn-dependent hydrolase [Bacteroidales bacterium]
MKNKCFQIIWGIAAILSVMVSGCGGRQGDSTGRQEEQLSDIQMKLNQYVEVTLTTDISHLSAQEKEMLPLLFKAADIMDHLFWKQDVGDKDAFLAGIKDPDVRRYALINYGPWDHLDGLKPFIDGYGEKPKGAEFYPHDMTVEEFEAFDHPDKTSLYTVIRRGDDGALQVVWYHEAYRDELQKAAGLLREAAALAGDPEFAEYLKLRAEALVTSNYQPSDLAWLDVRNNNVDLVIGPIENYTDQLFGYKAAFESFILIKDKAWSERLNRFAQFLPQLQKDLPVSAEYKTETPGFDADLNAYDAIYYAGDCNAGSKTIAINLPNDEEVHLKKGSRKLQLKNAMKAKFDQILVPIAQTLIAEDQQQHINFDAFFANTMFHEVGHGMGIKNTINGMGTVRKALKEQYSAIEEGKADILGLFLVTRLHEMGEFKDTDLMDNYVTFMAGIFRSIRFGAASAHGKANMIRFNYFNEKGAFTRNENGTYSVDFEKMKQASEELARMILEIQGNGDYEAAKALVEGKGVIHPQLQSDLDRLAEAGIPVDIVFKQGPEMIGLK